MNRRIFLNQLCKTGAVALSGLWLKETAIADSAAWVRRMQPMMGSLTELAVFSSDHDQAERDLDLCFDLMRAKADLISDWELQNSVAKLRAGKVLALGEVAPELLHLARVSTDLTRQSAGRFNAGCYFLSKLWREARDSAALPSRREILRVTEALSNQSFKLSPAAVGMAHGTAPDFGGIGKGYIADIGASFLRRRGYSHVRVACSGDLRLSGDAEWVVEVEDPDREGILAELHLYGDVAVSTSGDYRNAWRVNGSTYHHLIDARTGQPHYGMRQTTIVAPNAMLADALATTTFFYDPNEALRFVKRFEGAELFCVDGGGKTYVGAGLKDKISILI